MFHYSLQHLDSCQKAHMIGSVFLEMLLGFHRGFGGIPEFFQNLGCSAFLLKLVLTVVPLQNVELT